MSHFVKSDLSERTFGKVAIRLVNRGRGLDARKRTKDTVCKIMFKSKTYLDRVLSWLSGTVCPGLTVSRDED